MVDKVTSGPSCETERFEGLETYRGLAALMIVVFHAYQNSRTIQTYVYENTPLHLILRNFDSGVAVFLALSGFLIFLPFAHAFLGQQPYSSARGFLIQRTIRIVPLYYIAILVVWYLRFSGGTAQWLDLLVIVFLWSSTSYYVIEYPTQFLRHLFTRKGHLIDRYSDESKR